MKLFQLLRWLDAKVMLMKEAHGTLLKPTFEKGQHVSKGVLSKFKLGLISIDLTSALPSPLPKL